MPKGSGKKFGPHERERSLSSSQSPIPNRIFPMTSPLSRSPKDEDGYALDVLLLMDDAR